MTLNKHMIRAIEANTRYDGRKNDEYRNVDVSYDISWTAGGSAKVTIGNTTVLAGITLSVEKPYSDTPNQGNLMVEAELKPIANSNYESGPPSIDAIELSRVIDRGIRESGCIDLKKLCITPGEKVWFVVCDICTLNADGNLFDAASLAAMAALSRVTFPTLKDDGSVDYKTKTDTPLPMVSKPIAVTIWKVGKNIVVDPTYEEEKIFDGRLTVTTVEDGTIVALQKGGDVRLTADDVLQMIELASAKAKVLRKNL
ncbi:MAG: exosome complex component RRP42 [Candidatus Woesearchaeota archaeon]|jgi:exosome complex component RRP42